MEIKKLIAVAAGEIHHIYNGLCPDSQTGQDSRDTECPACKILTDAAAEYDELVRRLRDLEKDVERYRILRRGQHWSTVDGIGDTLRGEALDRAIDAVMQPPRVGDCTEVKPS